jgi:hypothetical protein
MAQVNITIPDALAPRLIAAMNSTFPEATQFSPTVAFKELTARYWRAILVEYEAANARRDIDAQIRAAIAAANAQTIADAAGIQ